MWRKHICPIEDDLHDVFFLNQRLGWAYTYGTGILLHTTDGGDTWSIMARLDPIYWEQIQFVDDHNGWLCGEYGFVYRTLDGGNTWQDVSPVIANRLTHPYEDENPPDGILVLWYAMYLFNSEEGFVAGTKMNPAAGWDSRENIFLLTRDGGQNWQQPQQAPPDGLFRITFVSRKTGFASGAKTISCTHDGGQTWQVVYEETKVREQFRGLYFLTPRLGWVSGFSGRVLKTMNGGYSWEATQVTPDWLRDIAFFDEQVGFTVGDKNGEATALHQTEDGGKTWQKVNLDASNLHRIKRVEDKMWVVGKQGTILSVEASSIW